MLGFDSKINVSSMSIGIIETNEIAISDNGQTQIAHSELTKKVIATVIENTQIYSYVLPDNTSEKLAEGIYQLVNQGVSVINISVGISENSEVLKDAVTYADNNDVILVCAAGNNYSDLLYPAAYKNTISVLARTINNQDVYKDFSIIKKKSFSAPGVHVLIDEAHFSGSSIACSFVSAQFLVAKEKNPNLSKNDLIELIKQSTSNGSDYSYGVINTSELIWKQIKLKKLIVYAWFFVDKNIVFLWCRSYYRF